MNAASRAHAFGWQRAAVVLTATGILAAIVWVGRAILDSTRFTHCAGNLRLIGVGLNVYHDIYGCFPPPSITDANGKPLHSWRRLIVPVLCKNPPNLALPVDLNEPWDSPKNLAEARQFCPTCYVCPAGGRPRGSGITNYVMIVGSESASHDGECVSSDQITDGANRTIIVAEIADSDILWSEPRDLSFDEMSFRINDPSRPSISSNHVQGALVVFADGHTQVLDKSIAPSKLKALITSAAGD